MENAGAIEIARYYLVVGTNNLPEDFSARLMLTQYHCNTVPLIYP
jgi:hypothetical protein